MAAQRKEVRGAEDIINSSVGNCVVIEATSIAGVGIDERIGIAVFNERA